jgi:hypothetical protein
MRRHVCSSVKEIIGGAPSDHIIHLQGDLRSSTDQLAQAATTRRQLFCPVAFDGEPVPMVKLDPLPRVCTVPQPIKEHL